jgi:RNA polymerase sigma factor (sigma-70 family)
MSALDVVTRPADQGTDDLDLVAGVRAGDDRAFELLFLRYQPRIASFVRGMVNDPGRAEDITQEVFISALRRMRETDRVIAFKPWIYEIAKNACIDSFRRSRGRNEVSFDAEDALGAREFVRLAEPGATPDLVVEGKAALDNLCGAFGGLSQTHHEILVMREFEGLSYREIGERLGLSRPAVESTLFRARRRLSEEYEELVSGERCLRVQRIVDARGGRAAGLRDQRRMARHLAHCQPCRRYAGLAGVDVDAVAKRPAAAAATATAARIAALVPLPMLLRRRPPGAEEAGQLLGQQGTGPIAQWTANVAGAFDPALVAGWTKAVATAATVAVAGVGAGAAITERDALQGFIKRVPAMVSGSVGAGSGSAEGRKNGGGVPRRSESPAGERLPLVSSKRAVGRVGDGTARLGGTVDGAAARVPGPFRADGSGRSADPSHTAPGPLPPGHDAATKKKLRSITDRFGLASPRSGGGGGATGGAIKATNDAKPAVQGILDKLRGDGGSAGVAPTLPSQIVGSALQGLATGRPPAPAPTDSVVAPITVPNVSLDLRSTGVGDTVAGVSAALEKALPPAQPPS